MASGSNTNTINRVNQFTIVSIGFPVIFDKYRSGPTSAATSLFDSISKICKSNFVIESFKDSIFIEIASRALLASFNCSVRTFRVADDVVVTWLPLPSVYVITLFDNPDDNSDIDFDNCSFSIRYPDICSVNLFFLSSITSVCLSMIVNWSDVV